MRPLLYFLFFGPFLLSAQAPAADAGLQPLPVADHPEDEIEEPQLVALDDQAEGQRAISIRGVISLERQVLDAPLDGLVLRYGHLYGPGTGADAPRGSSPIHVADAARAALVAVERGAPGVYNIAEPNAHIATDKAARELGFRAMHQETRA